MLFKRLKLDNEESFDLNVIWAHVTFPHVRSFYLRVKTREEGTPWHGIRRHVDLIDDHCHASCQMDFLLAIRRSPRSSFIQSFVFPRTASTWHFASRTTRSCSSLSNVLIRTLRFEIPSFQSSRWIKFHWRNHQQTGIGKAWRARHSSQVKTCARRDRFPLMEFVMAQEFLATSIIKLSSRESSPEDSWERSNLLGIQVRWVQWYWIESIKDILKSPIVLLSGELYLLPDLTQANRSSLQMSLFGDPIWSLLRQTVVFISSASNRTH